RDAGVVVVGDAPVGDGVDDVRRAADAQAVAEVVVERQAPGLLLVAGVLDDAGVVAVGEGAVVAGRADAAADAARGLGRRPVRARELGLVVVGHAGNEVGPGLLAEGRDRLVDAGEGARAELVGARVGAEALGDADRGLAGAAVLGRDDDDAVR